MWVAILINLVMLALVLFTSSVVSAADKMKSSVSPDFPDGLHTQYLQYLADKMELQLEIQPMPLARRLKYINIGRIDVLVSVIKRPMQQKNFVYIEPAYEQLVSNFFILKKNKRKLNQLDDLTKLVVGVTTDAKYFEQFDNLQGVNKIGVTSLKQKILLLSKKRIHTFIHYKHSTLPMLKKMNLDSEVVLANYQPELAESHYFIMSKQSKFYRRLAEFEQVVKTGLSNGDFAKIRENYYLNR